mmetsp:Transcript_21639/g.55048  ORF Transcript_21639/g.55048 Transcript_21639/m.55048 type:complete len:234 (+) Transcript_21639:1190-1891(+)
MGQRDPRGGQRQGLLLGGHRPRRRQLLRARVLWPRLRLHRTNPHRRPGRRVPSRRRRQERRPRLPPLPLLHARRRGDTARAREARRGERGRQHRWRLPRRADHRGRRHQQRGLPDGQVGERREARPCSDCGPRCSRRAPSLLLRWLPRAILLQETVEGDPQRPRNPRLLPRAQRLRRPRPPPVARANHRSRRSDEITTRCRWHTIPNTNLMTLDEGVRRIHTRAPRAGGQMSL